MRLKIAGQQRLAVMLNGATNAGKFIFRTIVAGIGTARNAKALSATGGLNPDSRMYLIASIFTMFSRFPNA
jgi:hypothetical protein